MSQSQSNLDDTEKDPKINNKINKMIHFGAYLCFHIVDEAFKHVFNVRWIF